MFPGEFLWFYRVWLCLGVILYDIIVFLVKFSGFYYRG